MVTGMMVYIYKKTESDEVSMHVIRGMDMWVMNGGERKMGIMGIQEN